MSQLTKLNGPNVTLTFSPLSSTHLSIKSQEMLEIEEQHNKTYYRYAMQILQNTPPVLDI